MTLTEVWKTQIERFSAGELSPTEVERWQTTALRRVLSHVAEKSAFYRKRLAHVDLAGIDLTRLDSLPYTTKSDLADAMFDIVSGDVRDALYFYSTTGTTGRPTPCPRSAIDVDLNNVSSTFTIRNIIEATFGPSYKPILAVLPPNELHSVCMNMSFVARELGICKFDAFPLSPVIGFERMFKLLLELRVDMLLVSPGLAMAIAEMADTYGIDVKEDLRVKCILCTGELCSPSMTRLIETAWGAKVFNYMYGSQEAGCIAVADVDSRMRPLLTNYVFEVIDLATGLSRGPFGVGGGARAGASAADRDGNAYGELCLTMLVPGMKPLIRYRTGDLVRMAYDEAGAPVIDVLGRVKDMIRIGGKLWSASEIDLAILSDHRLIYGYQLEIGSSGSDGQDTLLVRVKPTDDADPVETKRIIAKSVRDALGLECTIELLPLLDMRSATGGWVSWKSSRVKDLRHDPEHAHAHDIETISAAALARAAQDVI